MFRVISVSAKNLAECTTEFQQQITACLQDHPEAVVGSCQSPTVVLGKGKAFGYYASAIIHDRFPDPENKFDYSKFSAAMGRPVAGFSGTPIPLPSLRKAVEKVTAPKKKAVAKKKPAAKKKTVKKAVKKAVTTASPFRRPFNQSDR